MNNQIVFNSLTEVFTYPDGLSETLEQYTTRKAKFDYIQTLQDALEELKVLYQNPGSLNETEYKEAKNKILDDFEWWEANIFNEFGDA
jgi:uncharacterized glyoxalase superfamily metalloenzyme YdcJ